MEKYKNKDGTELNFGSMTEEGKKGSGVDLIQEVVGEAIKMCKQYNMWEKTSCQIALHKVSQFLKVNFDMEEK